MPAGPTVCRRFRVPQELNAAFTGALAALCEAYNWEEYGELSPDEAAALAFSIVQDEGVCMAPPLLGCIVLWPSYNLPAHLLRCAGQTVFKVAYPDLWEVWPDTYKDEDTLTLPDLRDRFVKGAESQDPWEEGGQERVTLTTEQLPSHTHTIQNAYGPGTTGGYLGEVPALVIAPTPETASATGSGVSHENQPEFTALVWCVVALP
jgi:microcystin-dependent protein